MQRKRLAPLVPLLAAALSAAVPATTRAGLVDPGDSVNLISLDTILPAGSPLQTLSTPFTVDYGVSGLGDAGLLHGTFTSSVFDVNGRMTFVYDVKLDPGTGAASAAEASKLSVAGFGGFSTSVTGLLGGEVNIPAGRSLDGATLWMESGSPGLGGAPTFVVATNATGFDGLGSATFFAGDELLIGGSLDTVYGQASFQALQPAAVQPNPSAVPLPPAFYSGLGVLMAMLAFAVTRRFWGTLAVR